MSLISIDSGSSYLKAFDGKREVWFPAVVLDLAEGERAPNTIHVRDKAYLVGDAALRFRTSLTARAWEPDRSRGYHGSERQHVQMCQALAELGVKDGSYEKLLVSLPYLRCQEQDRLDAVARATRFEWKDTAGPHKVEFGRVVVTPQGVGALRLFEREAEEAFDRAMLVDIGSCTTDVVTVWRGAKGWCFFQDACTSLQELSTTTFYREWLGEIRKMGGFAEYSEPYHGLMERAITGQLTITHFGERISIAGSFERGCQRFSEQLRAAVERVAGSQWAQLNRIVLTGGGACLVRQEAFDDPRIHVLGVHANAQGQFHFHHRETIHGT